MKKLIFVVLIIALLALVVVLPISKGYKTPDKVVGFWTAMFSGSSAGGSVQGFNLGQIWSNLKKSGGDIQAEARGVPTVGGAADLLDSVFQESQKTTAKVWNIKLNTIPIIGGWPIISDFTFGNFLLGILIVIVLISIFARVALKVGGEHIATGQGWINSAKDDMWMNIIRGLGVVGLVLNFLNTWNNHQPNSQEDAIVSTVLPIFLIAFALPWIWEKFKVLQVPGLQMDFWHRVLEFLFAFVVLFMALGALSGVSTAIDSLKSVVGGLPYFGWFLLILMNLGTAVGKNISLMVGIICSFMLVNDRLIADRVKRTPRTGEA